MGLGLMELNRSYSQLEKELIAKCLDVAHTGREVRPLGRMMIFLAIVQAPVQDLPQSFICICG